MLDNRAILFLGALMEFLTHSVWLPLFGWYCDKFGCELCVSHRVNRLVSNFRTRRILAKVVIALPVL
jgi:hypothetical protein